MSEPYRVSMTGKPVRHLRPLQNVRRLVLTGLMLACLAAQPLLAWEHWGGNAGGTRFSALAQITPANVNNLVRAWEFHTGDLEARPPAAMAKTVSFSARRSTRWSRSILARARKNGDLIRRFRPHSGRATASTAAVSPIGSIRRRLPARPAAVASSPPPTTSALSRSMPGRDNLAKISATMAR